MTSRTQNLVALTLGISVYSATTAFAGPPQNLVVNGDFSTGSLAGWTTIARQGTDPASIGGHVAAFPTASVSSDSSTNQFAYFGGGGWGSSGSIFQSIATTSGITYSISFDARKLGGNEGGDMGFEVTVFNASNGLLLDKTVYTDWPTVPDGIHITANASTITDWNTFTYTFQADSAATKIVFTDITAYSGGSSTDLNLDHIVVSAVPEPSTYAAIAGLGALGFAALRRRRSA